MKVGPFVLRFVALLLLVGVVGSSSIYLSTAAAQSLSPQERAQLEADLAQLEADLAQKQKDLANQQQYSGSLSGDIKVLTAKINAKKAEIKTKTAKIAQLSSSITEKKATIVSLSDKIDKQKQSIAQLIRKTDEMDRTTLTQFLLSSQSISDFSSDDIDYDSALRIHHKASVK
jgi:septal ring factor EnvC (AmiA/AmiB activator)